MDVFYKEDGNESEEEKKSIFVKVPLMGDASKNFKQVYLYPFSLMKGNQSNQRIF